MTTPITNTTTVKEPATSAAAVMKLIEDQLTEERSTKSSLESRAIGVVTSSGALAALLFALAALVTESKDYQLPDPARYLLIGTLCAFIIAAVLAILAARPGTYQEVTVNSLQEVAAPQAMSTPAEVGSPKIALALVRIIETARERNAEKAKFLRLAVAFEAWAAVLLAVAVGVILLVG